MQENSPLYTMASSLEDALDNILQIMAEWLGESEVGMSMCAPSWMFRRRRLTPLRPHGCSVVAAGW
jgi:hypothetical protein